MSILGNIVRGATVALASGTAINAQDNIVTPVPVKQHIELNELPNVLIPNLFQPPAETFRNPSGRLAQSVPYDSIGEVDRRRAVTHGERAYDPVVQMITPKGICTSAVSKVEGFESRQEGTIYVTAAHCVTIEDEGGNVIGLINPNDIRLVGSYMDSQDSVQTFSMRGDTVWVNPLYEENIKADKRFFEKNGYIQDVLLEGDTAIIFSKDYAPSVIKPVRFVPVNYEQAEMVSEQVLSHYKNGGDPLRLTVAGHSSDKPYLTADENASVANGDFFVNGDFDGIYTESDGTPGRSGGPAFDSFGDYQAIKQSPEGEPIALAVNSTSHGEEFSRHNYLDPDVLRTVPFLKLEGTSSDLDCRRTGQVTAAGGLKIMVGPGLSFEELVPSSGQMSSVLPFGSQVSIHGTIQNTLKEQWGLATTQEGRTGYVHMGYVKEGPKVCFPVVLVP